MRWFFAKLWWKLTNLVVANCCNQSLAWTKTLKALTTVNRIWLIYFEQKCHYKINALARFSSKKKKPLVTSLDAVVEIRKKYEIWYCENATSTLLQAGIDFRDQ